MIKKIVLYILLFFIFVFSVIIDLNIKNYIKTLEKCFNRNIPLDTNLYVLICSIIGLISILMIVDILLIFLKKQEQNKGINFKTEDGTHGTSNWMSENEMKEILGFNDIPGIILGKYNNNIVKLPFDSYFNKNICVFGSSGSMKTIRFFINKLVRTFKI